MKTSDLTRLAMLGGLAALVLLRPANGQSPEVFEVASIRYNLSGNLNTSINVSAGRLTVKNATLKTLIRNAYDVLSFQFAGGPGWLDTDMFDIVATTGGDEKIPPERLKLLLKNLLADRFRLRVHWETRETAIYALVPDKGGPKISHGPEGREPGINGQKGSGKATLKGTSEPLSILASNLGNHLGRIVIDKTGLTGVYDWMLEWDPDLDPAPDSTRPSLFTALEQQLGLRLEPQRGPTEILVIDSAQKPSGN